MMKALVVVLALFGCAYAGYAPLVAAPVASYVQDYVQGVVPQVVNKAITVPESRFTRSDWIQPGAVYTYPAVQRYTVQNPGVTTYHKTAVPVAVSQPIVHAAPVVHSAPLLAHGGYSHGGYAHGGLTHGGLAYAGHGGLYGGHGYGGW